MRVTTNDGHAWLGKTLLRPHYMDHTLADITHAIFGNFKLTAVTGQGLYLQFGNRIGNTLLNISSRYVVIGNSQISHATPWFTARKSQPFKSLRRGHLMQQLTIDVEQHRAIRFAPNHVAVKDLVVECLCCHRSPDGWV